jgi:hypothetical protein
MVRSPQNAVSDPLSGYALLHFLKIRIYNIVIITG